VMMLILLFAIFRRLALSCQRIWISCRWYRPHCWAFSHLLSKTMGDLSISARADVDEITPVEGASWAPAVSGTEYRSGW
jgi:hypothetical protein